jgi:hypothetical protein
MRYRVGSAAAATYRASGLVHWPNSDLPRCPLWRRYWGISGHAADMAKADAIDPVIGLSDRLMTTGCSPCDKFVSLGQPFYGRGS